MHPGRTKEAVAYRLLVDRADLEEASAVISAVWNDPGLAPASLLRAYTHFGNPTIGAFVDGRLVGACVGFLAPSGGTHLHSHITGVLAEFQLAGIGSGLKAAQRDWCLANGIGEVTWTFDPMLARNAHFNLRKLGAVAEAVLPDFYGPMNDAMNKGDATDRLEVHWYLSASPPPPPPLRPTRAVAIPADYAALRAADAAAADRERLRVRAALVAAFEAGLRIVDFNERGEYVFTPRL